MSNVAGARTPPTPVSAESSALWERVAADPELHQLRAAKTRFVIPATVFFLLYYLALPILVGYAPRFMRRQVLGPLNLAYLFALSQFLMTWLLAGIYMRRASGYDARVGCLLARYQSTSPAPETR